jgi:hypothetical protein
MPAASAIKAIIFNFDIGSIQIPSNFAYSLSEAWDLKDVAAEFRVRFFFFFCFVVFIRVLLFVLFCVCFVLLFAAVCCIPFWLSFYPGFFLFSSLSSCSACFFPKNKIFRVN